MGCKWSYVEYESQLGRLKDLSLIPEAHVKRVGAGGMFQKLRVLAVLSKDPSLVALTQGC